MTRVAKRPRKPRSARPARAAATARENGAKGGRPRNRLPQDLLDRIGPPPDSPLQLARWASSLLAQVAWLQFQGKVADGLAATVRATVGAITRAQPTDIMAELERLLREDAGERAADDVGPQPEKVSGAGPHQALRVDPR